MDITFNHNLKILDNPFTDSVNMQNLRIYGNPPYSIALLHGGPGAPGYMAPVAKELAKDRGVLEPLQTATSLEGQIQELKDVLEKNASLPVTLVGHSWGAMLGYMFAAIHPALTRKLIMVSSGVFEPLYTLEIMAARLGRLSEEERTEVRELSQALDDPMVAQKNAPFARMGALIFKADSFDPITNDLEVIENQYDMIKAVWPEVEDLRADGDLVKLGQAIKCPVVAIHGDYDPHPPDGVQRPLSRVLKDFRFIMLKDCGHYPWLERKARDGFYEILKNELNAR